MITVVISKPSCVSSIVWSAFTRIFRGLVWAVGCFLPRASTLRMRLADDLGLVPFTTSLCGRLTADDDCFFRCAPCGGKCLVATYAVAFSNEIGGACRVSWEYRLRVGRLCACWNASGTFLGMSSQFRQLCPSSSETRCATCLSANCGGVAALSWLIHVATA